MSTAENTPTVVEFMNSLNGFDFISIKSRFGVTVDQLQDDGLQFLYALVYVAKRREGLGENEAYIEAMNLPLSGVQDYFAPEPDEIFPNDPETEAGKDS